MNYYNEKENNFTGVLKITNQKTLEMWKKTGKYKKLIDSGLIYNIGCGRFRDKKCTCCKCSL
jgi:hypothetical protein